jgi:hypothetical protein
MSDFQSFHNAVLEDDDLQKQVISIVNTATANGAVLGDGIATLGKTHGYAITLDEVYTHADFLGQDVGLTGFELELISGGAHGARYF